MTLYLTRSQSRDVDARAIADFGMSGLVLMENAGRGVADVLCRLGVAGPVLICCGKGNNAGDGFVIARHLDLRGHPVRVLLWADADELTGDAAANYRILQKTGVPIALRGRHEDLDALADEISGAAWLVDALLGTGAQGAPRPPLDTVIEAMNRAGPPILAVDIPSGMDCDSGAAATPTIHARHTCTFVAEKIGFATPAAAQYTGTVHVLDIGAPRRLLDDLLSA